MSIKLPNNIVIKSEKSEIELVTFEESKVLPSFPSDIFPQWLQQYTMAVQDATQTPYDASGMAALSVLSTALAKKFKIRPFSEGTWVERNNLYNVVVMSSGERKSTVHSMFIKPIIDYEKAAVKAFISDNDTDTDTEQKSASSKMSLPRFIADDVTPEKLIGLLQENNERMALLSSEGGLFEMLDGKRYSTMPNLDVYLKGYTGDYLTVDRIGRKTEMLEEPILTIGLFVQPSVLQGLPERFTDRGLFGRFLYAVPKSMRGKRDVTPKSIDRSIVDKYESTIQFMMQMNADNVSELTLSEEAQVLFLDFLGQHEENLNADSEYEFLKLWTDRLPAHLLKIASLVHVAEHFEGDPVQITDVRSVINRDTLEKVLASRDYFYEHTLAAFGCIKVEEEIEAAKYLWGALLKINSQTNDTEFRRQFVWQKTKGKFAKSERLHDALKILKHRGYIDTFRNQTNAEMVQLSSEALRHYAAPSEVPKAPRKIDRIPLPKENKKG
ncbi:DUF3987 domain-containing protein [Paenibacillus sp. 7124]|uniref:DUF3987 domain-containing protein n=1 Tax=Paenibacillus apii TaxID=1850370 RepID=A0A6M1PLQ0_9BACL|nr:YfjI family protein [Paenibacillus apii]NGM83378.1 DUF3987 domain-containing protein [Paenibacillus apii]